MPSGSRPFNVPPMLRSVASRFALLFLFGVLPGLLAQTDPVYRKPSPALAALVDAPAAPGVSVSPDRKSLLILERTEAPSIAELAQPELRLAGIRFNPATSAPSRALSYTGLLLKSVAGGAERRIAGLPPGARITHYAWAPSSRHLALALLRENGLELWVVEAATAKARRLTQPILNAVLADPFVWLDANTVAFLRVPAGRGPAPLAPRVPTGPTVQENLGKKAPSATYEDLLANAHDEAVFEHYGTAELTVVPLTGKLVLTPLNYRGLITNLTPSPDGQHLIVEAVHRPFSYLVQLVRFPKTVDVLGRTGTRELRVADLPLYEGSELGSGGVRGGPRQVSWRTDQPATLSWIAAIGPVAAGDTPEEKKPAPTRERDAWFTLAAPFTGAPAEQQRFEYRVTSVTWGDDSLALVTESWQRTRTVRTWRVAPGTPGGKRELLFERSSQDRYRDPGRPVTARNATGRVVLQRSADGSKIYLNGLGASPDGDRPFLDELDLATKETRRLWRSEPPVYEEFVTFTDDTLKLALTQRQSANEPENYYVRDLSSGSLTALTAFPNPYPQFAGVKKELIRYKREDGVALSGTLYLPPGYTPEQGPLPTLLWAYPREFLAAETAEQITASGTPEKFVRLSVQGPLPFLLAGYAILNDPTMPIIAPKGKQPNDTYVEQLVANASAAIDELVRRGVTDPKRVAVGGHSYGAFMTANLLAHSRLFRAGIARSGAYNRTLTPYGFQSETRTFWQAPEVYAAMSPFNFANKIKDPLLLIHGEADNNSGTFPIQSERFYNALKGQGATTRFTLLPHESHGYRARESLLHMLWEMETWLDVYVKAAPPEKK
ncbi:MAG: prolyl oligopeptidase family serine peptidase [Verrucomicrobia bacterium]|nr:prolyl oligopeptidase family serine peptidase [Verrucomicrobiota bacterium]